MRILLAIDPAGASDVAVKEVAQRPWPPQTCVEVLSVVEPHQVFEVPSLIEGLEEAAEDAAESASRELRSAEIDAISCVRRGHAKDVIVERARGFGADFVIVGSRGLHGMERFLLGSVAAAVARFAPCSVEIVRSTRGNRPRGAMKILLTTDGSEFSLLAARSVAGRPWPSGTSARILSVAELSVPLLKMPYFSASAMEELRAEAMRRAEEAEMAAQEILTNAGIEEAGTVLVPAAAPKELILHDASEWGADLIVCGSHGRRGLSHFLLGSVSEAVATHATCSVEIIRQTQP